MQKAFGTNYGLTIKVPKDTFAYTQGKPKEHVSDYGLHREFCDTCGGFILEYGVCSLPLRRYMSHVQRLIELVRTRLRTASGTSATVH